MQVIHHASSLELYTSNVSSRRGAILHYLKLMQGFGRQINGIGHYKRQYIKYHPLSVLLYDHRVCTIAFTIGNEGSYVHDAYTIGIEWV